MALKRSLCMFRSLIHRRSLIHCVVEKSDLRFSSSAVELKKIKNEDTLVSPSDPDLFGTLSGKVKDAEFEETIEEGDIREEEFLSNKPLSYQKLTIKQYSNLIKQHIQHKQLKEAINVLEIKMLKEDRVKPANYIYNILIGACADVGYTEKAFKLYNDMKKRALKVTGDTYTCLFNACANSPFKDDGLKRAKHLREIMQEKMIEPNLTNYNSMIKAFGRCGDLSTAFQIADEMKMKGINIRVHTINFLLQACISDKENGLRHALILWRKMLDSKEKPNIFTFNLLLKCIKDCNFGSKDKLEEIKKQIESVTNKSLPTNSKLLETNSKIIGTVNIDSDNKSTFVENTLNSTNNLDKSIINDSNLPKTQKVNLLSKIPILSEWSISDLNKPENKFELIIGNKKSFLDEMAKYSVKPDIKTFTQLLSVIPQNTKEENSLMELIRENTIRADIDFYNMLIKKRCFRGCYDDAKAVMKIIEEENALRKAKQPLKKHLQLKLNVLTYGVLALTCKIKEDAEKLLKQMEDSHLKVNIEILGAMLGQGVANFDFGYILFVMNKARDEKLKINEAFLNHLKTFNTRCMNRLHPKDGKNECTKIFARTHGIYRDAFNRWLKEVDLDKALNPQHPWKQFQETQPETLQRKPFKIELKKKTYKRKGFVRPYRP